MAVMFIDSILRMVIWNKTITSLIYNFDKNDESLLSFTKLENHFLCFQIDD